MRNAKGEDILSFLIAATNSIRKARIRWKRARLETRARQSGTSYCCRVLTGLSDYNLSINSDMTVSCNCQDDGGAGVIGDLSCQCLKDVFHGPRATAFRRALASGRLPILTCACCSELLAVGRLEAERLEKTFEVPRKGVMVENTVACNLHCVACERARVVHSRKKPSLSLDDMRRVSMEIRQHGIETVYFFKYGEPFLSPDVVEEIRILRADNPNVRIVVSTNGIPIDSDSRRDAALDTDLIYFSIDGVSDAVLRKYQRGGSFERSFSNMRELVRRRDEREQKKPEIEWKYVVFNWNDRPGMIRRAMELAEEAGVDAISFWPTTVPYHGVSWRYRYSRFWQTVGKECWKGREVRLSHPMRTGR